MLRRPNQQNNNPSEVHNDGNPSNSSPLLSVMGKDAKLEGKFDIADSIEIECEIGGELKVGGKLVIGGKGSVYADVRTVDAIVQGEYKGNMVATGSVEITPSGRVDGNIETNSLVISKGGFFNGNVVKLKEGEAGKPTVQLVKDKPRAQEG
ncbi:MAG: polymer-forming cytoskeletal protein [Candidatus Methylomirabilales bacterium]